ncbi:MAG: hypothetical protein SOY83_05255 [Anaerovoracaceae bacterium]|nr:hypothetical protein [Bacillota bacterium]MDY3954868.1 hypothetical protein [Anaerovoracaceae bacterium]
MKRSKAGSIFVEASIVLPLTVISIVGAFALTVGLWERFDDQVEVHLEERNQTFREDADFVRKADAAGELLIKAETGGRKGAE